MSNIKICSEKGFKISHLEMAFLKIKIKRELLTVKAKRKCRAEDQALK